MTQLSRLSIGDPNARIIKIGAIQLDNAIRSLLGQFFTTDGETPKYRPTIMNSIFTSVILNLSAEFICNYNTLAEAIAEAKEFNEALLQIVKATSIKIN